MSKKNISSEKHFNTMNKSIYNFEKQYEFYILKSAYKRKQAIIFIKQINNKLRELIIKNNFEQNSIFDRIHIASKIENLLKAKDLLYKKYDLTKWNIRDLYYYSKNDNNKCFYCKFKINYICHCKDEIVYTDIYDELSNDDICNPLRSID